MDPRGKDPTMPQRGSETMRPDERHTQGAERMASEIGEQAEKVTHDLRRKAQETAQRSGDTIDQAMTQSGAQITQLAQTMRERRPQGKIGEMTTTAADALERGGQYLQEHDLNDVRSDVEGMIRRYPIQSLLITAGLGFMAARTMKR